MVLVKNEKLHIAFIRPGMTQSGKEKKFLGYQDEGLLQSEKERIKQRVLEETYPKASLIYTGCMTRCRETAFLIYQELPALCINGFEPFDYGEFEGKTYRELIEIREYRDIIVTEDLLPVPGGESPYVFSARVASAFKALMDEVKETKVRRIAIIAHQNVIFSILRRYCLPRSLQLELELDYGGGLVLEYDFDTFTGRILNNF